ncbi:MULTISPECIES: class I SAM-dependent methyltransferase [unclassified Methanoregula]|uniref:class I SAM-dependent methyltransferase n=1 Tax=unclassified Methanoregula TaxID=2649730 RepID=UPI0009D0B289|nr:MULTISPECIES: class I SAM-dependent methyltransferase [unclassified Methanoregula]OPX65122.1 MAG: bifunctional 3-demethylubiquinone-9 3-methyltransferase/ 2-octaprenyl-6-hydroxy phenol methylase [Methanoregula sp. PtaB.Bin085]OPY32034.1 MAG: bifunctional 3-demethylubiquinone-9 3-methyltransferase/ 2-octaprenyl-6-hydroxy phenol methylase [Methanoregula sp. PtaU1.Bin006]
MNEEFDGAGNLYNKYESKNPIVRFLMTRFFLDLDRILCPIRTEISSALEIGCGEGYVTNHLNAIGIPVAGSDVSSRIIDTARKKFPDCVFFTVSVYELGSLCKKYDLIVANEVLEHLKNPDEAIENIRKISRKYILFSVPNEPYFRLANILRAKYVGSGGNTPGHINHWSKRKFEDLLKSHGLKIRECRTSYLWTLALCEN